MRGRVSPCPDAAEDGGAEIETSSVASALPGTEIDAGVDEITATPPPGAAERLWEVLREDAVTWASEV
jgi:hypothetical protein